MKKHGKLSDLTQVIISFEHTGMYSIKLATYLTEANIPLCHASCPSDQQSIGIRKGKSDQIDAQRIAEYAWLHRETLVTGITGQRLNSCLY